MSESHSDQVKVTIVFVHPNGERESVEDSAGRSVMDFAVDHGIQGIEAQCGGASICTTCLCRFSNEYYARLDPAHVDELEMLEYVPERQPTSRLACQILVTEELHGLEVLVDHKP